MSGSNHDAVRNFYELVGRGEFPAATEIFADDLTWVEPPFPGHDGGTFHGKANILTNVLGPFVATWSGLSVRPQRITAVGDEVIVHGLYAGQHHQTGRPFEARFIHTWTLRDGRATRFEMLADTVQFFRTVRPHTPGTLAVQHRTTNVAGLDIFYREAGPVGAPVVLLLHGFPSSSHMFRDLIPALADEFHVIAPDYPGFGLSAMPAATEFEYTFDHVAEVVTGLVDQLGLSRYTLYLQDYGAPIGFRLATARPERVAGLVVQNGNAYVEGLSDNLAPLAAYMSNPTPETEAPVRGLLKAETTRWQYTHGMRAPDEVSPEAWIYDQYFLDRPGNEAIQLALFRSYASNLPLYDVWQNYLRTHRPPTLVTWGKNDPFFTEAGARAFLKDVPAAELHLLDAGHFALEQDVAEIAQLMRVFLRKHAAR